MRLLGCLLALVLWAWCALMIARFCKGDYR